MIKRITGNPLLKNIAVYAVSDGLSRAMPFLVFPIVAYYLSTDEFGLVTNFNVYTSILLPFVVMSTPSILSVDFYKTEKNSFPKLYANLIYLNTFLLGLAGLIVVTFHSAFSRWSGLSFRWLLLGLLVVLVNPFVSLFTTRLRMEERARYFGVYNIVASGIAAALTLLFVAGLEWSWEGRLYSIVLASVIGAALPVYSLAKLIGSFRAPDMKMIYGFLIFALPLLPHNLSFWLKTGFEKLFISATIGLHENGVYSFASTLNSVFTIFAFAFFSAFSPYVYKKLAIADQDPALAGKTKLDIVKSSYLFLLAYLTILIIGFAAGWIFTTLFFQEKYGASVQYLPYFLCANFFGTVYSVFSVYLFYTKRTNFLGIITIGVAFIQVLLTIFLVEAFGAIGAGLATAIASILTALPVMYLSNKIYPMPWTGIKRND